MLGLQIPINFLPPFITMFFSITFPSLWLCVQPGRTVQLLEMVSPKQLICKRGCGGEHEFLYHMTWLYCAPCQPWLLPRYLGASRAQEILDPEVFLLSTDPSNVDLDKVANIIVDQSLKDCVFSKEAGRICYTIIQVRDICVWTGKCC